MAAFDPEPFAQPPNPFPLPRTRAAAVSDELRRQIRAGELAPGTRLRQAEIAQKLGVSTTPVREALSALAREGLVHRDAQRGAIVFVPSEQELQENYEIRIALEALAARLATPNLTQSDFDYLGRLIAEMRSTTDGERSRELNADFHARIYQAAGRPRLAELIEGLRDAALRYMRMVEFSTDPDYWAAATREHGAIRDALIRRDADLAGRLIADHLERSASHLREQVFAKSI